MSVDLKELGLRVDKALAKETKESLTAWLNERRGNAEASTNTLPIDGVVCSALPEDSETEPYCIDCGNNDLAYIAQYANGNYWKCRECDKEFIY